MNITSNLNKNVIPVKSEISPNEIILTNHFKL